MPNAYLCPQLAPTKTINTLQIVKTSSTENLPDLRSQIYNDKYNVCVEGARVNGCCHFTITVVTICSEAHSLAFPKNAMRQKYYYSLTRELIICLVLFVSNKSIPTVSSRVFLGCQSTDFCVPVPWARTQAYGNYSSTPETLLRTSYCQRLLYLTGWLRTERKLYNGRRHMFVVLGHMFFGNFL